MEKRKRTGKKLGILLLVIGIPFIMSVLLFADVFDDLEDIKNKKIAKEQKHQAEVVSELYAKVEKLTRKQMRLNLQNAEIGLERAIEAFNVDMLDWKQRVELLSIFTATMQYYDKEGNTFVINTNGEFEIDDDHDCGQPMGLIDPSVPLINLPTRKRYYWDEIAWQLELKYFLYMHGIIDQFDKSLLMYVSEDIQIIGNYDLDYHLNNVKIYRTEEIQYIKNKYPDLFTILRRYKVIMHSDFNYVEPVLEFFNTHRNSDKNTNLFWYFNETPYKEILEIIWLPAEKIGFNNESKSFAGGTINENYLRVGIVQGAQIQKVFDEYSPTTQKIVDNSNDNIRSIEKYYNLAYKLATIAMGIFSVLFVLFTILTSHIILNKE